MGTSSKSGYLNSNRYKFEIKEGVVRVYQDGLLYETFPIEEVRADVMAYVLNPDRNAMTYASSCVIKALMNLRYYEALPKHLMVANTSLGRPLIDVMIDRLAEINRLYPPKGE